MKKINKTLQAAKVTRRSVLKGAAATSAAAAIGPYYVPNAFAAPVVNVLMWGEICLIQLLLILKQKQELL